MRLFGAELEKLATRRTTWVSLAVLCAGFALVAALTPSFRSLDPDSGLSNQLMANTFFVGMWAWFVCAAGIGAELASGTLGTLLTHEPRRPRVLAAKLAACLTLTLGVALAFDAASIVLAWSPPRWPVVLAGLLSVAVLAVLGFTASLVGGGTLVAMGVLVGWGVLAVITSLVGSPARVGRHQIGLETLFTLLFDAAGPVPAAVPWPEPVLGLALVTAAAVAACLLVLTRRDVR